MTIDRGAPVRRRALDPSNLSHKVLFLQLPPVIGHDGGSGSEGTPEGRPLSCRHLAVVP